MSQFPANTFGSELLQLAIATGVAVHSQDGPMLPSEPSLSKLMTAYKDAAEVFGSDRAWSWKIPLVSITLSPDGSSSKCINGDPCRYSLGTRFMGQPFEPTCDGWNTVSVAPIGEVRQAIAGNQQSGGVYWIATETQALGSDKDQSEVVTVLLVAGTPTTADVLTFKINVRTVAPEHLTDVLLWGPEHHRTVRLLARVELIRNGSAGDLAAAQAFADAALERSRRMDSKAMGVGPVVQFPGSEQGSLRHQIDFNRSVT